jgi:hypothetical protein
VTPGVCVGGERERREREEERREREEERGGGFLSLHNTSKSTFNG